MASRSMDDEKKSQSNQNGSELANVTRLSILIDATGSMSSLLAVCKITIQQTVPMLKSFIAKSNVEASFEVQIITGAQSIFTSNETKLTNFIESLEPNLFKQLNEQKKKPNIVLLMSDATKADSNWKEGARKFMKGHGNNKIFCFYVNRKANRIDFEEIAKIGNGKAMYLDLTNQQKSVTLVQGAISETILYAMNNGDFSI